MGHDHSYHKIEIQGHNSRSKVSVRATRAYMLWHTADIYYNDHATAA